MRPWMGGVFLPQGCGEGGQGGRGTLAQFGIAQ
jgi:hypothetical protein